MFLNALNWADLSVATSVLAFQLLPSDMWTCTIYVFSDESSARPVQLIKNDFVWRPRLLEISFSNTVPSWSSMQCKENEYMLHRHKVPLLQYVSDHSVPVHYRLTTWTFTADLLSVEPLIVAALLPTNMLTFEALHYCTVCVLLIFAPEVTKRGTRAPRFRAH